MKNVIIWIFCLRSKIFYAIPGTKEYIEGTKEGSNNYLKTKLLIFFFQLINKEKIFYLKKKIIIFGFFALQLLVKVYPYILEFVRKNMNEL